MAFAHNAGSRLKPRWRARYRDINGDWQWTKVPDEHTATKKKADAWAQALEDSIAAGRPDPKRAQLCGPLLETWLTTLSNRNKLDDAWRAKKHLLPRLKDLPTTGLNKRWVVQLLRELKAENKLSGSSQRSLFSLLSRFAGWLSADDTIEHNPCGDVPAAERPVAKPRSKDRPWLSDEATVQALIFALPPDWALVFATANRTGCRVGEAVGLRLGDLAHLEAEGTIHIAHSFDGVTKESQSADEPREKDVPLHDHAVAAALLWLAKQRREAGAVDDDHLFGSIWQAKRAGKYKRTIRSEAAITMEYCRLWRQARDKVPGLGDMKWHEATRTSCVSRNLRGGARYEEASSAAGHSSPAITEKHYNRHRESKFASIPYTDLGAAPPEGKMLPFRPNVPKNVPPTGHPDTSATVTPRVVTGRTGH